MKRTKLIVRNYASSAFNIAVDADQLNYLARDVDMLQDLIAGEKDFLRALDDEFVNKRKRLFVIDDISARLELLDTTKNLLKILVEDERILLLPEIIKDFERLFSEHKNIFVIEVAVTNEDDVKKLEKDLKHMFKEHFKDECGFKFKFKIDSNLVGGFVLNAGSYTFDASIRNKLRGLERDLIGKDI